MAKQATETVSVRLEGDDVQTLAALVEVERLSKSDVIRRALRSYAERLGVLPKPKPKR